MKSIRNMKLQYIESMDCRIRVYFPAQMGTGLIEKEKKNRIYNCRFLRIVFGPERVIILNVFKRFKIACLFFYCSLYARRGCAGYWYVAIFHGSNILRISIYSEDKFSQVRETAVTYYYYTPYT